MAKEETKAQELVSITPEALQTLLTAAIQTAMMEAKKPLPPTQEELDKVNRKKQFWHEQEKINKFARKQAEERCGHRRPEDNRSLIHWAPLVFPNGAWYGTCCRCPFELKNYEPTPDGSLKLVSNDEFEYWRKQPVGW